VGQGQGVTQPTGVHRRVDQRPGGRRGQLVAGHQFRDPGQVLGHLPVPGPGGGLGQPHITGRRPAQVLQLPAGERGGHLDGGRAVQDLAGLRVPGILPGQCIAVG
jgi:hypothetical protein